MTETARPLVTFALFAYNQEKYIREAVEGAFSQTYEPLEIILSDDCSSDRTYEIMQEMATEYKGPHRVVVRRNTRNLGLAGHLNEVIAFAQGEIISWAAGDDISLPERTQELCQPLIRNHEIIGTHSSVYEIDTEGKFLKIRRRDHRDQNFNIQNLSQCPRSITTQSHAFWRRAFDHFGPFRSDLTHEGYAMTFREAALGEIRYLDKPLTKYRIGSGVSTYSGHEMKRMKISEPLKISRWHYTTALQMQDDIESCPDLFNDEIKAAVRKNVLFFHNLLSINLGQAYFFPLLHNMSLKPLDKRSLRAALRKFAPAWAYKFAKGASD